ncbi:DUF3392 family protein [Litoribrevibacter albus]|uniref:DUF3392 domain-containing protein n=1 Tax=Litoribrevibacter albus TaxID=1473156 RepID=A0AA37W9L1_9GAMM|nr:DUF3392 family protein [Litoribrevibacter albus]GLQ32786.1 hypothetical protein GCM10007876_32650 [Litoribrevibacter albus]
MEWFWSLNSDLSGWFWGYRQLLITSWVAVLLVIYGGELNAVVRRIMQPYHVMMRMTAFILLCTFGYGALAVYGQLGINFALLHISKDWFAGIVIVTYLVLSVLAERKRHA